MSEEIEVASEQTVGAEWRLIGGDFERAVAALRVGPAVLAVVTAVQGSAPREAGAWMLVQPQGQIDTIGGGQLEWVVSQRARDRLHAGLLGGEAIRSALGPSLGQCCGGRVEVWLQTLSVDDVPWLRARWSPARLPVALFGAGHVGQALYGVLRHLPVDLHWFDRREGLFPDDVPPCVVAETSDPVWRAVAGLPAGTRVLIMNSQHDEDLAVTEACLRRWTRQGDMPWIGLIGSHSKWAVFRHRLLERGIAPAALDRVTCPIGVPGVQGKEPAVIAVAVAAQLMMQR